MAQTTQAPQPGSTYDRLAYARSLWAQDPSIPVDGPTGMIRKLYERYGQSAAAGALETIRREVRARTHRAPIGTNVGTKIAEAQAARPVAPPQVAPPAPVPSPPPPKKRKPPRVRPAGAFSVEQQRARLEYARGVFMQRPDISLSGADSMEQILLQRFGCSVAPPTLTALRAEVKAEIEARKNAPTSREVATVDEPPPDPPAPNINDVLAMIGDLALEAIPQLRKLSIDVDDTGAASVGYTVREVTVVERGGAISIRGRS